MTPQEIAARIVEAKSAYNDALASEGAAALAVSALERAAAALPAPNPAAKAGRDAVLAAARGAYAKLRLSTKDAEAALRVWEQYGQAKATGRWHTEDSGADA